MTTAFISVALVAIVYHRFLRKLKTPHPLPPGPKPLPFLGNVNNLTAKELWLPATKWAKQFGDVVYLHVLGQGIVFLNSAEAAIDLLDKRGAIYSDKPKFVMAGELCGCKNMVAFTQYNSQSKRQRRLLHKAFGAPVIPTYHPLIQSSTMAFLRRLISSPASYQSHIRRYAGGLTLSVVYGYEPSEIGKDEFLDMAEECVNILSNKIASGGGIWLVDVFPSLQYLPDGFPGTGFKTNARIWKRKMEEFVDRPYEFVKNSMKRGIYKPSFCSTLLDDPATENDSGVEQDIFEFDLKWTANSMYSGSIDTTIATISHFLLAVMQYPEVVKKAREEIERVVGTTRMPNFAQLNRALAVKCVYLECLRWGAPVPMGLPHRLIKDDIYRDRYIPEGTFIFSNIWAILRDERLYPDPNAFNPDRFMESSGDVEADRKRDPRHYVFGFGRRQCPGMNLVDSSVWILIVSMLATVEVTKPVNEHGEIVEPEVKFENPIFRTPSKFNCDIRPRSEKALGLIMMHSDTDTLNAPNSARRVIDV
ncbi:cytochrome P450 [Panaeolus papilionaceus]|nr:cytochrome P450 [Panaeolus papilionaceus]